MASLDKAPHMDFSDIWTLKDGPNSDVLQRYLQWLTEDGQRFESATSSMQWLPVGFNSLLVARRWDEEKGTTAESLQLNFYHGDQPGNEGPHGHSRPALTSWYSHPDARQVITRHLALPEGAPRIPGFSIEEHLVAANCIVDFRDGKRPGYHPIVLGSRFVLEQSETRVAPLGSQKFNSLEVHHIGFEGPGVSISTHYKGEEETAALSEFKGLIYYKGLTPNQAEEVIAARAELEASQLGDQSSQEPRLGPVTMLYPSVDFEIEEMKPTPTSTSADVAELLILGGLKTASYLAKVA